VRLTTRIRGPWTVGSHPVFTDTLEYFIHPWPVISGADAGNRTLAIYAWKARASPAGHPLKNIGGLGVSLYGSPSSMRWIIACAGFRTGILGGPFRVLFNPR